MMQIGIVGMGRNGFMNQIMQSEQNTDKIIKTCEQLIAAGYNPNIVIEQACYSCGVSMNSLTDMDKQRLVKKVEEIYRSNQTRRDR
jgi:hypothetical protein